VKKALLRNPKLSRNGSTSKRAVSMAEMPGSPFYNLKLLTSGVFPEMSISPSVSKKYNCNLCPMTFNDKSLLATHQFTHSEKFTCRICRKIFVSKLELKTHRSVYHKKVKPFECSYCKKCFESRPGLEQHVRIHTGEKPFQCKYCLRRFVQKGHLTKHLASRQNREAKPFACHLCCRRFISEASLKKHQRVHKSKKAKLRGRAAKSSSIRLRY